MGHVLWQIEPCRPTLKASVTPRIIGHDYHMRGLRETATTTRRACQNPKYTDIANKDMALLELTVRMLGDIGHKAKIYGPYPYSRGVAHIRVRYPMEKTA